MAGGKDETQIGELAQQFLMRIEHAAFLAFVGGGGDPDRPPAKRCARSGQRLCIDGQRAGHGFQVHARRHTIGGGMHADHIARHRVILRHDQREDIEQVAGSAGPFLPELDRFVGHARIDQRHRRAGGVGPSQHLRPDLAFDKYRGVGLPMGQEPL